MRLVHFSDDPNIRTFEPKAVRVLSRREPGSEWLNGPLVWAIDDWHSPLYLFPRDCPRILVWPKKSTTADDLKKWWDGRTCRMIAHIEWAWFERVTDARLYRYELPEKDFECLGDAGMWVSRSPVE
jgi:hypothetical protein